MMKRKRRRPRRKKQIVDAKQPSDIPYHKYRVEWMDILSDSGWATDKEFHRMKLAFPVNAVSYTHLTLPTTPYV